jgi:uncharacterized membrane protein
MSLRKNTAKIVFVLLVLAYSILAAYNYSAGESGIPAWLYGAALCVPPLLALLYARETILALFPAFGISSKTLIILYSVFGILCAFFIAAITCARYYTFSVGTFDFGIFAQMFDNMKKTGLPFTTLEREGEILHFQVHISPIYYLILPFYCLFPFPATLQIAQAIIIALGLIPLRLICKGHGLSNACTAAVGLLYIFFPALSGGAMYDIHENCFLTVVVLFVFYSIEAKKNIFLLVSVIMVLAVKENATLYVMPIALYFVLSRKDIRRGLLLGIAAVFYFFITEGILATVGETMLQSLHMSNFLYNGTNESVMGQVLKAIIMNPAYFFQQCASGNFIQFLIYMLLPLAGLILYQKNFYKYILFAPFILFSLTPVWRYYKDIGFQYNFANTGIFFFLAICCLEELKPDKRIMRLCVSIFAAVVLFSSSMLPRLKIISSYNNNKENFQSMESFLTSLDIPPDASLTASPWFTSHLWKYRYLYVVPSNPIESSNTDYVVIDARTGAQLQNGQGMLTHWGNYTLYNELPEKIQVYKRTTGAPKDMPGNELNAIRDFEEYLEALKNQPYTVLISARDEASQAITPEIADKLKALGVRSDLREKYRWSYICVLDGGASVYEELSQEPLLNSGVLTNGPRYTIQSAGFEAGDNSSIKIEDREYSVNARGLNFVILDPEKTKVMDSVCFDTFSTNYTATRDWNVLNGDLSLTAETK